MQQRQDRRRSAARLALAQGHGTLSATAARAPRAPSAPGGGGSGSAFRLKKHHLQSRVLDEKTPFMMKKTTYLTNDATSVHQFKSLADEKSQRAKDVDRALEDEIRFLPETLSAPYQLHVDDLRNVYNGYDLDHDDLILVELAREDAVERYLFTHRKVGPYAAA